MYGTLPNILIGENQRGVIQFSPGFPPPILLALRERVAAPAA
jgi:hypothetical protein